MNEQYRPLIDNYDKKCHLLALEYQSNNDILVGICSLCGQKNAICELPISNLRCSYCRAKIEDDTIGINS